jgi:hypothetical protein
MESFMKSKKAKLFLQTCVEHKDNYHDNFILVCALIDLTLDEINDAGPNYEDSEKERTLDEYVKKYKPETPIEEWKTE